MSDERRSDRAHPRHRHRARAHESAHAAAEHDNRQLPDNPLIPRGDAELIIDNDALTALAAHVRTVGTFAYDSEFIGELSYHPQLCLIQVATHERVALVDPLADLDLNIVWDLLCDPSVEKVMHAGEQDVEPVVRNGRVPVNIFDTQIAAGFIALPYPLALSKLLRQMLDVHIGKGFTFTHWDQRPLSSVQLRYAADDVRFLPALRVAMADRLAATPHAPWVLEESAQLADPARHTFEPARDYIKIRGAGGLPPHNLSVLKELAIWRDQAARTDDLPPRSFLRDEILIDLARRPIRSESDLARVKGLPRPVESRHGRFLVELTARAMAAPTTDLPQVGGREESPEERYAIDALSATAQVWCMGRSIDIALAASRGDIVSFYRAFQEGRVEDHKLMRGWRKEALGDALVGLLNSQRTMRFRWEDGLKAEEA